MSVALLIRDSKEEEYTYLPVAAESFFKQYWLPKAIVENLDYVTAFRIGVDVNQTNIQQVLNELKVLQNRIPSYADISQDIKEFWLGRLLNLINTLESRQTIKSLDAFIG